MNEPRDNEPSAERDPRPARGQTEATDVTARKQERTDMGKWLDKARQLPEVRKDLIRQVKARIDAGNYETPERLEIAVQRLMEDML